MYIIVAYFPAFNFFLYLQIFFLLKYFCEEKKKLYWLKKMYQSFVVK